jgi:hypothetical protein
MSNLPTATHLVRPLFLLKIIVDPVSGTPGYICKEKTNKKSKDKDEYYRQIR